MKSELSQKHEIDKVSLIPYGERDLIIGGDEMEKFNGMPVYWLGYSIGKLMDMFSPSLNIANIAGPAINVRNNIEWFDNAVQGFLLSKAAAKDILIAINVIISTERLQKLQDIVAEAEQSNLNLSIFNFQAVLLNEFAQTNIFYISQKRAYDMTVLINQGQNVLSRDTINLLGSSKDEVINDIREATKCLAFDIPTAVGFHVYRAIETIVKEYFPILKIAPKEWENNKNFGHYIKLLVKNNVDVKVTSMLQHLKDHYRNPIAHPEEFWDSDKAESAFMLAVSVITVMVQDIGELKKKGT